MKKIRVAFADPPYLGQAHRYDHAQAGEFNRDDEIDDDREWDDDLTG